MVTIEQNSIKNFQVSKVSKDTISTLTDHLAVEEPLEIQLQYGNENGRIKKSISVTMRTPGDDQDLAIGFLFTEGIISNQNNVSETVADLFDPNKIIVTISEDFTPQLQSAERNFYTTSSCGVCGKSSIDAIKTVSAYTNEKVDSVQIGRSILFGLQKSLSLQQKVFQNTGGLHASALFDFEGNFICLREDVGRHNALDKVIGHAFLNDLLPLNNIILLLSGRASFELIQKAGMAGIKVVAAIGAPSSLAAELAESLNITLIGFLGNEKFNIYTGHSRIALNTPSINFSI